MFELYLKVKIISTILAWAVFIVAVAVKIIAIIKDGIF